MATTIDIQILRTLGAYSEGQIVTVEASNGAPVSRFWRRRLKDSAIDGFCKILDRTPKDKVSEAAPKKERQNKLNPSEDLS